MHRMKNGNDVSDETVDMALEEYFTVMEADKPKPKFEPIKCHCFEVGVSKHNIYVMIRRLPAYQVGGCALQPHEARDMARAIISAAAFVEANK